MVVLQYSNVFFLHRHNTQILIHKLLNHISVLWFWKHYGWMARSSNSFKHKKKYLLFPDWSSSIAFTSSVRQYSILVIKAFSILCLTCAILQTGINMNYYKKKNLFDTPGITHHKVKVSIVVNGGTNSRVVVEEFISCDLQSNGHT